MPPSNGRCPQKAFRCLPWKMFQLTFVGLLTRALMAWMEFSPGCKRTISISALALQKTMFWWWLATPGCLIWWQPLILARLHPALFRMTLFRLKRTARVGWFLPARSLGSRLAIQNILPSRWRRLAPPSGLLGRATPLTLRVCLVLRAVPSRCLLLGKARAFCPTV